MRKALNENPRVQLAVLGIGAVVLLLVFMTSMGGGGSEPAPEPTADPAASSATEAGASGTATPAPETEAATPAPAATAPTETAPVTPAPATAAPATEPGSADGLLASEGLPEDVLVAYAKNKAIALLVIDPDGIADGQLKTYTDTLRSRDDVEVFVVKAKKIADYARITQGVAVSRTPALVVIRPRDNSDGVPTATVSEGFRGAESVETALEDALYDGPDNVPSYPE